MSKNCNEVYKSANELNKHILKHSGMVWDYGEKNCDYSTDVRSFKCVPCDKYFKYFMQLK